MFSEPKILGQRKRNGQILAIFIVVLAAIFIMIAITFSLGRMSIRKTAVENVADSTALMLASHLGSYAKLLSDKYVRGGIKVCHFSWSDLFKIIITIVIIVIAIFVSIVTVSAGGEATWPWVVGMIVSIIAAAANITGTTLYFAKTSPGVMNTISRQFKKMGRKMQFKEAAVYHALSKVVDDPVMVTDIYDFDEDGLITDTLPRFNFWYTKRAKAIAAGYYTAISDVIDEINIGSTGLENILNTLQNLVENAKGSLVDATRSAQSGSLKNPLSYIVLAFPTQLVEDIFDPDSVDIPTQVYDCLPEDIRDWVDEYQEWKDGGSVGEAPTLSIGLDILNDLGDTLSCFSDLYGNYLPTWLLGGYPNDPPECSSEVLCTEEIATAMDDLFYNDKFDSLIFTLDYTVEWANAFVDQVVDEGNHAIIDTIDFWAPMLYCGGEGEEYLEADDSCSCLYHLFEEAQGNIADIMVVLPIVAGLEALVGNEAVAADILALETEMAALWTALETLQAGVKLIYEKIAPWLAFIPTDDKYIWNDSRGWHYVNVYVGGFKVPSIRVYRKGCCTRCVKLSRYEGTANIGISRRDAPMEDELLSWPDPLDTVDWSRYGLGKDFIEDVIGDSEMPDYNWDVFSPRGENPDSTVYFGNNESRPLWTFDEEEHTIASYARASWRFKPMDRIALICTDRDGMACVTGELDPGWLK